MLRSTAVLFLALVLTGCSIARSPTSNMVDVTSVDFSNIDTIKRGSDCAYYLLGFIGPFGDLQLTEAIEDGKINRVKAVDYQGGYYLLYGKSCINVYGD